MLEALRAFFAGEYKRMRNAIIAKHSPQNYFYLIVAEKFAEHKRSLKVFSCEQPQKSTNQENLIYISFSWTAVFV